MSCSLRRALFLILTVTQLFHYFTVAIVIHPLSAHFKKLCLSLPHQHCSSVVEKLSIPLLLIIGVLQTDILLYS